VFVRETQRSARRWQTYAMRFAFAGLLFAGILTFVVLSSGEGERLADPSATGEVGRLLFRGYTGFQLAICAIAAPLLVGLGVAEERDAGNLQLLTMTHLTAGQILWGKVGSRLLTLLSFVVGGLPVLALIATFGGVGLWEVVNATVNSLLVIVVLGTLGGIAALFSGTGLVSLMVAFVWAIFAYLLVPLGAGLLANLDPLQAMPLLCPPWAMYEDSWRGLIPAAAHLPVIWFAARLATPLFALITTRERWVLEGPTQRDPELALAAKAQRRIGVAALFTVPWLAISVALALANKGVPFPTGGWLRGVDLTQLRVGVAYAVAVLVLMSGTGLIVLIHLRVAAIARAVLGGNLTRASALPLRAIRAIDQAIRPLRRPVWPNPVFWRESMTRGLGAATLVPRIGFVAAVAALGLLVCIGALDEPAVFGFLGAVFVFAGVLVTLMTATTSVTTDRSAGTIALLLTTTMSAPRVLLGKVGAVGATALPWVVFGVLLISISTVGMFADQTYYSPNGSYYGMDFCTENQILLSPTPVLSSLMAAALVAFWFACDWATITLVCLAVGLRAHPPRVAFGLVIALGAAAIGIPVTIGNLVPVLGPALLELWWPVSLFAPTTPACGVPWTTLAALPLHALVPVTLFGLVSLRLRAWVLRDVGRS